MRKMKRHLARAAALAAGAVASVNCAMATADSNVTAALTDVSDTWDQIRPVIVAIGVFAIGWAFIKRVRRA